VYLADQSHFLLLFFHSTRFFPLKRMRTTILFRQAALAAGLFLLVGAARQAHAQAPGSGGPTPTDPQPTDVPLDGGASLLLAGSLAYGVRQLRQRRRK